MLRVVMIDLKKIILEACKVQNLGYSKGVINMSAGLDFIGKRPETEDAFIEILGFWVSDNGPRVDTKMVNGIIKEKTGEIKKEAVMMSPPLMDCQA